MQIHNEVKPSTFGEPLQLILRSEVEQTHLHQIQHMQLVTPYHMISHRLEKLDQLLV